MPVNQSGNSFFKSSVDLMDLAASGAEAGLVAAAVVETGAGHGSFVPGHVVIMAFLDLQAQGDGAFPGGMYHGMGIMTEPDLVFARESANAHESIWELLYQVISGPDGLGCFRG